MTQFTEYSLLDSDSGIISHRPYVPSSCCKLDGSGNYQNEQICGTTQIGPPGDPLGPYINKFLHYTVS